MTAEPALGLVEQREFLRRSLADLGAELAAGDIEQSDYDTLQDQYTARLADVLRQLQRGPNAPILPRSWWRGRRVASLAIVTIVAVAAGLGVARFSGTRVSGQSITGEIRQSTSQRLDGCLLQASQGQLLDAVKCYDQVLLEQPSSVEARTYRGWALVRTGDERLLPLGAADLDQAVAIDPSYPDAHAFRAVVLSRLSRGAEAKAELDLFDSLDPPKIMRDLVTQFGLRERVAELQAQG